MTSGGSWSEHVNAVFDVVFPVVRPGRPVTPVDLAVGLLLVPDSAAARWLGTRDFDAKRALTALGHFAPAQTQTPGPVPAPASAPDAWSAPDARSVADARPAPDAAPIAAVEPAPPVNGGPVVNGGPAGGGGVEAAPASWSASQDWSAPESWAVPGDGTANGITFSPETKAALKAAIQRGIGRFGTVDLLAGLIEHEPVRGAFAEQGITAQLLPAPEATWPAGRPRRNLGAGITVAVGLLLIVGVCILGPILF